MEVQMMIFELNSKECRQSDPEAQDKKVKLKAWIGTQESSEGNTYVPGIVDGSYNYQGPKGPQTA